MSACVNTNHQDYLRLKEYLGGDDFNVDRLFADYKVEVEELKRENQPLRGDENWPNSDFILQWVDENIHFGENTSGTGQAFVMSQKRRWDMTMDLSYNKTQGDLAVDNDYMSRIKPAFSENFAERDKARREDFAEDRSSEEKAQYIADKANDLAKLSDAFKDEYDANKGKGRQTVTQLVSGEEKAQKEEGGESNFSTETGTFTHTLVETAHKIGRGKTHEERVDALKSMWNKERAKDENPLFIVEDKDRDRMCEQVADIFDKIEERYDIVSMEAPVVLHSNHSGESILGRCDIIAVDKETGQGVLIDLKTHVDQELPTEGQYSKFFQNYNLTPVGDGTQTAWDHAQVQTIGYAAAFNQKQPGAIERRGMLQVVIKGDPQTGHVSDFALNTPRDTEVHGGVVEMYNSAEHIQRASSAFREMHDNVSEQTKRFESSIHDLQDMLRGKSFHAMETLAQEETYKPPLRWLSGLNVDGDIAATFKGTQLLAENFIKKLEAGITSIEQIAEMTDTLKQMQMTNKQIGEVSDNSNTPMIIEYGTTILGYDKNSPEMEKYINTVQEQLQWMDKNVSRCEKALEEAMKNHFYTYVAPDVKDALLHMGPIREFMQEEYEKLWKEGKRVSMKDTVLGRRTFQQQYKKEAYDRAMERYRQSASAIDGDINSMVDFLAGFSNTFHSATVYDGWREMLPHARNGVLKSLFGAAEALKLDRLIADPNLFIQHTVKGIEEANSVIAKHDKISYNEYEAFDKEILKLNGIGAIHTPLKFREIYDFCLDFSEVNDGHGSTTVVPRIIGKYDYERYNADMEEAIKSGDKKNFDKLKRKFADGMDAATAYNKISKACIEELQTIAEMGGIMSKTVPHIRSAEELEVQGEEQMKSDSELERIAKLLRPDEQYGLRIFSPEYSANATKGMNYIRNMAHDMLENMYVPSDEYMTEKYAALSKLPEDHVYRRFYDTIRKDAMRNDAFCPDTKRIGYNLPVAWAGSREGVGFFAAEGRLRGYFTSNSLHKQYIKHVEEENAKKGITRSQAERNRDTDDIFVPQPMSGYAIDPDTQSYDLASLFGKFRNTTNRYIVMNPLMAQFKVINSLYRNSKLGDNKLGENVVGITSKQLDDMRDCVRHMIEGAYTSPDMAGKLYNRTVRPILSLLTIGFKPFSQVKSHYSSATSIFSHYPQYFKPGVLRACIMDSQMLGIPNQMTGVINRIFGGDIPKSPDLRDFFGFDDNNIIRELPSFHGSDKSIQKKLAEGVENTSYIGYSVSDTVLQSTTCSGLAFSCDMYDKDGKHLGPLYKCLTRNEKSGRLELNSDVASMTYADGTEVKANGNDIMNSLQRTAKMMTSNTTSPNSIFYGPKLAAKSDIARSSLMVKKIPINMMTASFEQYRWDMMEKRERIGTWEALLGKQTDFGQKVASVARGVAIVGDCLRAVETLFDKDDQLPAREKMPQAIRQQLEALGTQMFWYGTASYLFYAMNASDTRHLWTEYIKGFKQGGEFGRRAAGKQRQEMYTKGIKLAQVQNRGQENYTAPLTFLDWLGVGSIPYQWMRDKWAYNGPEGDMRSSTYDKDIKPLPKKNMDAFMKHVQQLYLCALQGNAIGSNPMEAMSTSYDSYKGAMSEIAVSKTEETGEMLEGMALGYSTPKKGQVSEVMSPYYLWSKSAFKIYKWCTPLSFADNLRYGGSLTYKGDIIKPEEVSKTLREAGVPNF